MGEQFAIMVVEKVVDKLLDPIIRHFSYVFWYSHNIKCLRDEVEDLQNKRSGVNLSIDATERNLQVPGPDVVAWVKKVNENEKKADEILEGTKKVETGCLKGFCPNLKQRYSVSRKAVKQIAAAKELQKDGDKYTQLVYSSVPAGMAASTPVTSLEVFESRSSLTKEVIKALQNENFSKIGICGLGGVGKTRMAKEIRDRAIVEDLFDEVAMAVVTENPDLRKIQDQLASMLGLQLEENNITDVRGKRLSERLRKGQRVLIILDDVWKELNLGELGIPTRGQSESKGCKVLITSRDEHVCTITGTEKNFAVKLLSENESWDLFKEKSGVIEEAGDLHRIAMQVSKECGGLPLALVTVGTALKGKGNDEWKDALEQLQSSRVTSIQGMEKDVYSRLRLSYNLLENNQLQRLFMLCCIFPEDSDISVEELVRYAMGLRLFIDLLRVESVRRRVRSLVSQLKSCYLLLASDEDGHVKVHDVVRDFGLKEASNGEHTYFVRHDSELKCWPQNDEIEVSTGISILSKEEIVLPPGLVCPLLKFLIFSTKGSIQVSDCYFAGMKELSLVCFHGQVISSNSENVLHNSSPSQLQFFMNVRTLCLEFCSFSSKIGFIGYMHNLEVLSLFKSGEVDVLPSEIGQLKNLKLLDLRNVKVLLIMPGVLSLLKKLEDLYLGNYFFGKGVEDRNQGNCASITELYSLTALRTLQISISDPNVSIKLKDFHVDVLTRFYIEMIQDVNHFSLRSPNTYEFRNTLCIYDSYSRVPVGTKLQALVRKILKRVEFLSLRDVKGMKNLIEETDVDVCLNLKKLVLTNSYDLIEICGGNLPVGSMRVLEKLYLDELSAITHLWKGQVRHPCFANLKAFSIVGCKSIQSLFSPSMVRCLVQLEELLISYCGKLVEIVSNDADENDGNTKKTEFPKLKHIQLYTLPSFKSFIAMSDILPNTRGSSLFNKDILLPSIMKLDLSGMGIIKIVGDQMQNEILYKLIHLRLSHCQKLSCVATFEELKLLQNLETLEIEECNSMQVLFDLEKLSSMGKLETIKLQHLRAMTYLWRGQVHPPCFVNLKVFRMNGCNAIQCLFSLSTVRCLTKLQELKISGCQILENIVCQDGDDSNEDAKKIVFINLKIVKLSYLRGFKGFVAASDIRGSNSTHTESILSEEVLLPSMERLCLKSMDATKIVGGLIQRGSFYKLKNLKLYKCGNLSSINSTSDDIKQYQNLEILIVGSCDSMKGLFDLEGLGSMSMLRIVKLSNLSAMTYLWTGQIHPPCFLNLKEFTIEECNTIRSLFSPSTVKCLVNLEELKISSCGILEVIISNDDEYDGDPRKAHEFPKLKVVELGGLPCLTSFSTVVDITSSQSSHIRSLFNQGDLLPSMETLNLGMLDTLKLANDDMQADSFCKLRTLNLSFCPNLSYATAFEEMKLLGNLEELTVGLCLSMETVFALNKEVASSEEVIFGRLETIGIVELPELKYIWKYVPKQGFHKLTSLYIAACDKLTYLFVPSMVKLLVNLQKIEICSCKMMEQVIMMEEDEDSGTSIVFPRLRELHLGDLERFKSFYEGNNALECPSLEDVSITFCLEMKYFCSGSLTAPKVTSITQRSDIRYAWKGDQFESYVWMGDLNSTILHSRAEERRIELERVRKLKEEENK